MIDELTSIGYCYKNALGFAMGSLRFLYRSANHTPISCKREKEKNQHQYIILKQWNQYLDFLTITNKHYLINMAA